MLGKAAVTIWCDVAQAVKEEFDDWHAHEHMPERLAIPGFLRGTRWVSIDGNNSYFVVYETESLDTVTSGPYLERLNNPTPWSRKIMPHHRNMVRSLCRVEASFGGALAQAMLTIRFSPQSGAQERLKKWLLEFLPTLTSRKGLVAAHLLMDAARTREMTAEQKIRGGDATADWVLLANGYSTDTVAALCTKELGEDALVAHGAASGSIARVYEMAYQLTAG